MTRSPLHPSPSLCLLLTGFLLLTFCVVQNRRGKLAFTTPAPPLLLFPLTAIIGFITVDSPELLSIISPVAVGLSR